MVESKIAATERLRREGRWEEASLFRDQQRERLRAEGLSRREAVAESWRLMSEKFPPLPPDEEGREEQLLEIEGIGPDGLAEWEARWEEVDLVRDTFWVYANLNTKKVTAAEAPSLGALGMLRWARKNQTRFLRQLLPKALLFPEGQGVEEGDDDPVVDHIERALADMRSQKENGVTEMATGGSMEEG